MGASLVAVASQKELKVFNRDLKSGALNFDHCLENDLVNLRDSEVTRHHPGMVAEGGAGVARHSMDAGVSPHQLTARYFARKISTHLDLERRQNRFSNIVIIAEPKLLGMIRSEMSDPLKKLVSSWIDKDLGHATTEALTKAVKESLIKI